MTFITFILVASMSQNAFAQSTKKERNLITAGNELYDNGRYKAALIKYQEALKENPNSAVAKYNLGLSQIMI